MEKITIGVVDDDKIITELLLEYFTHFAPSFSVLFTANSGEECLFQLNEGKVPKILLLDLKMKGINGLETMQQLKQTHPTIKVVVMSSHYQNSFIGFMMKKGASAYLPKDIAPKKVIEVINNVHQNSIYFSKEQIDTLRNQISSKAPELSLSNANALTDREIEILKLLCLQKTAKEIGEKLFVAPKTVEAHKNSLFAKTGVKNIVGLVIYAIQNEYVDIHELALN